MPDGRGTAEERVLPVRPSWHQYFMEMARLAATRATCDRRRVGAVIVTTDRHVIATGYNGAPSGVPHCDVIGHAISVVDGNEQCVSTIHAEQNAISMAAKKGHVTAAATMYCTASPCLNCAKSIAAAGISRIIFDEAASDTRGLILMGGAGVQVIHYNEVKGKDFY